MALRPTTSVLSAVVRLTRLVRSASQVVSGPASLMYATAATTQSVAAIAVIRSSISELFLEFSRSLTISVDHDAVVENV